MWRWVDGFASCPQNVQKLANLETHLKSCFLKVNRHDFLLWCIIMKSILIAQYKGYKIMTLWHFHCAIMPATGWLLIHHSTIYICFHISIIGWMSNKLASSSALLVVTTLRKKNKQKKKTQNKMFFLTKVEKKKNKKQKKKKKNKNRNWTCTYYPSL